MDDERLTVPAVAERLGIRPSTWLAYVARDRAPRPDGRYDRRTPWWYASTIDGWRTTTPA
jgi:hypothetical protein